jgi:hypothetical protein
MDQKNDRSILRADLLIVNSYSVNGDEIGILGVNEFLCAFRPQNIIWPAEQLGNDASNCQR